MFEVLVFVYENYYPGEDCPEPAHLQRKLTAVGFDAEEIDDALVWLKGLQSAAQSGMPKADVKASADPAGIWFQQPSAHSVRVYHSYEKNHLGMQCLGFISFMESAGCLPAHMREVVIDRALAVPCAPVTLPWRLTQQAFGVGFEFGKRIACCAFGEGFFFVGYQKPGLQVSH